MPRMIKAFELKFNLSLKAVVLIFRTVIEILNNFSEDLNLHPTPSFNPIRTFRSPKYLVFNFYLSYKKSTLIWLKQDAGQSRAGQINKTRSSAYLVKAEYTRYTTKQAKAVMDRGL